MSKKALFLFIPLTINRILLIQKGAVIGYDAQHRYIPYAQSLQDGFNFHPHDFWYISYVLIIKSLLFLEHWAVILVLIQILFHLVAIVCIFKTAQLIANNTIAWVTSIFFTLYYPVLQWNLYIQTDSLFISGTTIFWYFLIRYLKFRKGILTLLPIAIFIVMLRPNGQFLLMVFAVLIMDQFKLNFIFKFIFIILLLFSFNVVLPAFNDAAFYYLKNGEIVAGISFYKQYSLLKIPVNVVEANTDIPLFYIPELGIVVR